MILMCFGTIFCIAAAHPLFIRIWIKRLPGYSGYSLLPGICIISFFILLPVKPIEFMEKMQSY
jgi:hypothetical protein